MTTTLNLDQTGEDRRFWWQWVGANVAGELLGIAVAAGFGAGIIALMGGAAPLLELLVMIVAGGIEGAAIGLAQGWVLQRRLQHLRIGTWTLATAIGAMVAWALGMLPATMMSMESSGPPPEVSTLFMVLGGAGMGVVLSVFLSVPQWWVLRKHLAKAVWWIPANALAWSVGMAVMFVGASAPSATTPVGFVIVMGAVTGILAGTVVGMIQGWALLRLLRS